MRTRIIGIICLLVLSALFSGCGDSPPATKNQKVVASMKGVNLTGSQVLCGVYFTLELPIGVSIGPDPITNAPNIKLTGVPVDYISVLPPMYQGDPPGLVYNKTDLPLGRTAWTIAAVVPTGFGPGQSVDIDCGIDTGFYPQSVDFKLTNFYAKDQNGQFITLAPPVPTYDFY